MIFRMLKVIKIYLLVFAMWLISGAAMAKDLVVDRAIFEDVTAAMSLDQVKGAAFRPAPEVIFERFSRSTFWVRLLVDAPADAGPLAVRIRPTLLDSAMLYYPAALADGPERVLDLSARSAQKDARIELQPGLNTLYLRAESIGALLIHAQVMTQASGMAQDLDEYLELGAVLAIYALLTVVMVGLMVMRRDSLGIFFFVHLLVCLVLYILVFGFFETFLAEGWLHGKTATRLTVIANFLSFCLLMQSVMGYVGMRRLRRWTLFASAIYVVLMVLFFVADRHLVLRFTSVFGALTTFALLGVMLGMFVSFSKNKSISLVARLIAGFLVALFVAIVCRSMLQVMGVLEGGAFLLQSPAWRGVFIPLGLVGFLWQRDRAQNHALVEGQIEKAIAEVQMKDKTQRLATQSQFMAMLMHELKTPLYIIQVATSSLSRHIAASNPDIKRLDNIARAADDINFIIDRCVQADKLDQSDLPVSKTPVSLKTLLSEVKNIKGYERITCSGIEKAKVVTDFQYARIILINLVTNALKYSPPESLIQLSVQEAPLMAGHGLTIRITNAVAGAGRPDPLKVFTRYYRAEGAKKEVGAGLGLWLANSLAVKLGSELRCSSDAEYVHFDFQLELS